MISDLPKKQQRLYDLLLGRGDVAISALYNAMAPRHRRTHEVELTTADMQRWLGPYIVALNRKLEVHRLKVEPGALKATYRLTVTE